MNDTSLITFKAISNFTVCLEEVFGSENRSLKLYAHLISKTTIQHEKPILKHIECFRKFCVDNRNAIQSKDHTKLSSPVISYSDRVYINMKNIMNKADRDTKVIIWRHLLTISALVDPSGEARKILAEQAENNGGDEANFLSEIINKVEENVDPNANPMEAVSSILKSGVFQDLVQGMGNGLENGSLDLGKLMGTVQQLVTNLNPKDNNNSNIQNKDPSAAMQTMMQNLKTDGSSDSSQPPDLSGLINMMGPMLSAMNNPNLPPSPPP